MNIQRFVVAALVALGIIGPLRGEELAPGKWILAIGHESGGVNRPQIATVRRGEDDQWSISFVHDEAYSITVPLELSRLESRSDVQIASGSAQYIQRSSGSKPTVQIRRVVVTLEFGKKWTSGEIVDLAITGTRDVRWFVSACPLSSAVEDHQSATKPNKSE